MQARVDAKLENVDGMAEEEKRAILDRNHQRCLQDCYERIIQKLDRTVAAEKVVELLQGELNGLSTLNRENSTFLADLKQAHTEQNQSFETLKGQARYLEQYRVDSIFRVFSLKGQARILISRMKK